MAELVLIASLHPRPATAQPVSSSSLPIGELPAGDSTLFTGTVVHRVPLELPPARGGMVPDLAVVANHQTGDGILGMGWSLEGLSRIERRSATYGVPTFGADDTFFVDGDLLISDSRHCFSSACYRLEHDDNRIFSPVYANPAAKARGKLLGWQARRDGWTWTWGITASSVEAWQEAGSVVFPHNVTWLLSSIKDPHGNEITYEYEANGCLDDSESATPLPDGEYAYTHKISKITYAGGNATIKFDYEPRNDARATARQGELRLLDCRLAGISTYTGSIQYSAYGFDYKTDSSLTLLASISRRGTDGTAKLLRSMSYQSEATSFPSQTTVEWSITPTDEMKTDHTILPISVNFYGGNRTDLVIVALPVGGATLTANPHKAYRNNNECTSTVEGHIGACAPDFKEDTALTSLLNSVITNEFLYKAKTTGLDYTTIDGAFQFFDIDRDGRTELITSKGESPTVTTVYEYEPVTKTYSSFTDLVSVKPSYLQSAQPADIDGDGFIDLVISPTSTNGLDTTHWIRNTGNHPDSPTKAHYLDQANMLPLTAPLEDTGSAAYAELKTIYDDLGCDRFPDDASDRCNIKGVGTYTDEKQYYASQARYTDVNNDGIADLSYSFYVCWNNNLSCDGSCVSPGTLGICYGLTYCPAEYKYNGTYGPPVYSVHFTETAAAVFMIARRLLAFRS